MDSEKGGVPGFMIRHKLTIALVVVALLPVLGVLPEGLNNRLFETPVLLLGPFFLLGPIFLTYHVDWERLFSPGNLLGLGAYVIFGMVFCSAFLFLGLMTVQFICPDGYGLTDFSLPSYTGRRALKVAYVNIVCLGDLGMHQLPRGVVGFTNYILFLLTGVLLAGLSYLIGRKGRLSPAPEGRRELHFIRFFLAALVVGIAFLSLPGYFPGARFMAGSLESVGSKYPMDERRIALYSEIHGAVQAGDTDRVQAALRDGGNVNAIVNGGLTPLAIAVTRNDARVVRLLVEAGADVNLGESSGQSAMQQAFQGKNKDMIAYLLKHGGNRLAVSRKGEGLLTEAVKNLDLKAVRELLQEGADPNTVTSRDSQTVLYLTVFEVNTDYYKQPRGGERTALAAARLLIEHGADLHYQARYGHTPLIEAILRENPWMVELFLKHGADVNGVDEDGKNSLFHALRIRFFRKDILAKLVAKGVNVNHKDNRGRTPLIYVAERDTSTGAIEWLLRHGAEVNAVDKSGQTALDKLGNDYREEKKRAVLVKAGAKSALMR